MLKGVEGDRVRRGFHVDWDHFRGKEGSARLFVVWVIQPGKPCRQSLYRNLEFRMKINERLELSSEPPQSDFVIPSPRLELLNAPISEVHEPVSYPSAASIKARCCCR